VFNIVSGRAILALHDSRTPKTVTQAWRPSTARRSSLRHEPGEAGDTTDIQSRYKRARDYLTPLGLSILPPGARSADNERSARAWRDHSTAAARRYANPAAPAPAVFGQSPANAGWQPPSVWRVVSSATTPVSSVRMYVGASSGVRTYTSRGRAVSMIMSRDHVQH
jgi:hypothetical protein